MQIGIYGYSCFASPLPQKLADDGHSWAKRQCQETLSYSFRTVYSRALTGSARGKACGQALAGSLGPRGTARAPTTLQIHRETEGERENRDTQTEKEKSVLF